MHFGDYGGHGGLCVYMPSPAGHVRTMFAAHATIGILLPSRRKRRWQCLEDIMSMMTIRSRLLLPALLCLAAAAPAYADKRVALIIGNSTYRSVASLENPKNDAALMAETLRTLGFTLVGGGAQLDL